MIKHLTNPAEKRILIVEDEGLVAMTLEETLKRIGYSVVGIAMSGEEAIAMTGELYPTGNTYGYSPSGRDWMGSRPQKRSRDYMVRQLFS